MASTAVLPITYPGDPAIRGLARLPTMFTAADVAQGAGADTNIARALVSAEQTYQTFQRNTVPSGGPQYPVTMGPKPPTTPVGTPPISGGNKGGVDVPGIVKGVVGAVTNNGGSSGSSVDCSDISAGDAFSHPLDTANCLLNRFLFGIVAIVLLGLGVYIFAKD